MHRCLDPVVELEAVGNWGIETFLPQLSAELGKPDRWRSVIVQSPRIAADSLLPSIDQNLERRRCYDHQLARSPNALFVLLVLRDEAALNTGTSATGMEF